MTRHTPGTWAYFYNAEGNYSVYPAKYDRHPRFPKALVAEVITRDKETREADARLIAGAPEMRIALIGAVEAMRATELFMCGLGLETDELNKIVGIIDELLDRIDGTEA